MDASVEWSESQRVGPEGGAWVGEDFLAHARLVVAVVCTIIVYLNPAFLGRYGKFGALLILLYLTYSLFNLMILRVHRHYGLAWGLCLHATEVLIISLVVMATGGPQSRFLELYLFVFFVAACRWGFNGALLTSCACVVFLVSGLTFHPAWSGHPSRFMSGGGAFVAVVALSAGIVSSACLLSLLVERAKKRWGEAVLINRLVRRALPEASFRTAIGKTLMSVREHFDADQVRLAIQEIGGDQAVAWEVTRQTGKNSNGVQFWKLTKSTRQAWFAMPQDEVLRRLEQHRVEAARNQNGGTQRAWASRLWRFRVPTEDWRGLYDLHIISEQHSPLVGSWSLLAASFLFERKWLGRLTVYSPRRRGASNPDSQFLRTLVREVGPAVYNKYLVGRLRSQAQAMERARLAQHLHDGLIQSLIGLEMQIDLLRRTQTSSWNPSSLLGELGRMQILLHNEIANVREEMQRVRPLDVEPARLLKCLAGTVDRFRHERGISASFAADCSEVFLPPRVCTEVTRILQEALANVRKHSGAHKVLVSFARENGHYKLCVEDDGRGFGFTGRLSCAELEASSNCPLVIKEIVRAIGGELMIDSVRGSSARLEVLVPVDVHGPEESPREVPAGKRW